MPIVLRGIIGAILLFLGRELNFLFAAAMAAFWGFRIAPRLPDAWPAWSVWAFVIVLAVVAASIALLNERVGYFLSGFLAGSFFLVEYYAPGATTAPVLPLIIGGVIGSFILGLLTEWAMILVSSTIGAAYVLSWLRLNPTAEILVGAGLFVIGALTQVIIMQSQKHSER